MKLLLIVLAVAEFGDKEGAVSYLEDAAPGRAYVYTCGWKYDEFAQALFGLPLAPVTHKPTARDIVLSGIGGPVSCPVGPKRVVHVQGESPLLGPSMAKPLSGHYYLGPLATAMPGALQVYFAAEAYYHIAPWQRTGADMLRQDNSGKYGLTYTARNCVPVREKAFDALAERIDVYAGGGCHGSHPEKSRPIGARAQHASNYLAFRDYRYVLCMENRDSLGYITEKILYAFAAGAVPIYWGTREVFDLFNRNAFIYYDPANPLLALNAVAYLEGNRTAYDEMARQPIFAPGAHWKHFGKGLARRVNGLMG